MGTRGGRAISYYRRQCRDRVLVCTKNLDSNILMIQSANQSPCRGAITARGEKEHFAEGQIHKVTAIERIASAADDDQFSRDAFSDEPHQLGLTPRVSLGEYTLMPSISHQGRFVLTVGLLRAGSTGQVTSSSETKISFDKLREWNIPLTWDEALRRGYQQPPRLVMCDARLASHKPNRCHRCAVVVRGQSGRD